MNYEIINKGEFKNNTKERYFYKIKKYKTIKKDNIYN